MGYTDKIECPHCHKQFEVEVDIEGYGDDAYALINPIKPRKGVVNPTDKVTFWDELELERRLGK